MLHVPVLRAGKAYRSVESSVLRNVSTGEPVARVSQANRGLVSRDLLQARHNQQALAALSTPELLAILRRAAELFYDGEVLIDPVDGVRQSADEFVAVQSSTTGMPRALCRRNMEKIRFVMAEMETVLGGLTRGLDVEVLDRGWARRDGRVVSYVREADVLGAVLPSNSPGVHSLWIPALALKVPVVLKPGSQEPWTPIRVLQALAQAGLPPEALGFYPTDYGGAGDILLKTDRSMVFGDEKTVAPWRGDHRVQLHGPGWSKVIVGDDEAERWEAAVELMATSVAENGGRSCLNASGVWVPAHGRAVAQALARRLAAIEPLPLDAPDASIAAFSQPRVAHAISGYIDRLLQQEGAEDLSAAVRGPERVVEIDGCTFLRPTVIFCADPGHPLASCEFLFPFATVVECPQAEMLDRIGQTLVVTALTSDDAFRAELMASRRIDRLNLGPIPTSRVSWDQPHEGNLFEHLYRQRAFQAAGSPAA